VSRGEALGAPRLQLAALDNLAVAADLQGRWDEMAQWAERMRALAQPIGVLMHLSRAQHLAAVAAEGQGDMDAALQGHEEALASFIGIGYRRMEALTQQRLGAVRLQMGDAAAALVHLGHAQALYETLDLPVEACETAAYAALCGARLGQAQAALEAVDQLLSRLHGDLAELPAQEMLLLRWNCQQVLDAIGEARAAPMLEQLHADIQARASELTDSADRDRLIQAMPMFRSIVAAYRRLNPGAPAAG
jgi:tetratricopeptide (TPR) repeat protein